MKISHFFFVILVGAIAYAALSEDFQQSVSKVTSGFLERHGPKVDGATKYPMAVSRLAMDKNVSPEQALVYFNNSLAAAPRYRLEGQVIDRVPAGHLLVVAAIYGEHRTIVEKQTVALFGYPQQIAGGATIACRVCMTGMHLFAKSEGPATMLEEVVYIGDDKPGGWMAKPDRTSLDRK
jgi:hypothetical protein